MITRKSGHLTGYVTISYIRTDITLHAVQLHVAHTKNEGDLENTEYQQADEDDGQNKSSSDHIGGPKRKSSTVLT